MHYLASLQGVGCGKVLVPKLQVSRRADVPTALAARLGMGGVLLGFYRYAGNWGSATVFSRSSTGKEAKPLLYVQRLPAVHSALLGMSHPSILVTLPSGKVRLTC